jgi:hypothetical protein
MLTIVNFNYVVEKRGWTRGRFEQQGGFQENQQAALITILNFTLNLTLNLTLTLTLN